MILTSRGNKLAGTKEGLAAVSSIRTIVMASRDIARGHEGYSDYAEFCELLVIKDVMAATVKRPMTE